MTLRHNGEAEVLEGPLTPHKQLNFHFEAANLWPFSFRLTGIIRAACFVDKSSP